mgnify:CR=1 FL=1
MEIGIWFGLLILFGILEAVTVSVVSIWFMAGSLAAILAALCGASLPVQIVLFLAVSVALLASPAPLGPQVRIAENYGHQRRPCHWQNSRRDGVYRQHSRSGSREGGRRGLDRPQQRRKAHCRRGSGSGGPDRRRKTLCHSGGGTRCKCKK